MRTSYNPSARAFIADPHSVDGTEGRQVDWTKVPGSYDLSAFDVTLTANAAADAVAIAVAALPDDLPVGTLLYFGEAKEFARTTAFAAKGFAGNVPVEALPSALESGDKAKVGRGGKKHIPAGTVVVELTGGMVVPRAVRPGAETAIGLLETDADEDMPSDSKTGYGIIVGGVIYENLLPEATGNPKRIGATERGELQAAGVGTGWSWRQYADTTS